MRRSVEVGVCVLLCCAVACGEKRRTPSSSARAPSKVVVPPRPPPEIMQGTGVHLRGERDRDAHVAIVVANASAAPLRLSTKLVVERQSDGEWEAVEDTELSLRADCQTNAPECLTLVPGAELYPPSWLAKVGGSAQCTCADCANAPAGSYRFVARSCDGDREYRGTPFVLGR